MSLSILMLVGTEKSTKHILLCYLYVTKHYNVKNSYCSKLYSLVKSYIYIYIYIPSCMVNYFIVFLTMCISPFKTK